MEIYNEETFGPVAIVLKANGVDDAVNIANDSQYGLSSGVMTKDEEKGLAVARRLETGMVHINDSSVNDEPHVPFGGVKNSGVGRHDGQASIDTFTELRWITLERGGKVGTTCMAGCVISCCNVFVDEGGEPIVSTLQYETIGLLGSNLGLGSLDEVARLNRQCNDYGLDSIEAGAALGVAAEAGLARFGDEASFAALLDQMAAGSVLGRVLGHGAVVAGRVLGVSRIPAVKGQAMPAYDPRALKGNGVAYATSPMGADHTAGNAFGARLQVDPLGIEGQRELSLDLQLGAAMLDTTGLCLFARPPVFGDPQLMVDLINGRYGWGWSVAELEEMQKAVLKMELEFNKKAGHTVADARMPEYMTREPLPPHNTVFDVPDSEMDAVFEAL